MKIGLFGGSFDPIHNGHIELAAKAKYQYDLKKIIFIPLNKPWLKKYKTYANSDDRIKMCELAISKYDSFESSDVDIKRGGTTYMIDTIRDIKDSMNGDNSFSIIIGDDNLENINKWKNYEEIIKMVDILVAPRIDTIKKDHKFKNIEFRKVATSSSKIREKIKNNLKWENLVPEVIRNYINENDLYK